MGVLDTSDFVFHVELHRDATIEILDESNNQTVGSGNTLVIGFIYQGGIGNGLATGFNIFVFDRSDTTLVGTAETPESNLPVPFDIDPATPLPGSPAITGSLIAMAVAGVISTNNFYAVLVSGVWSTHHRGSFSVTAPSSGFTEDLTTFSGQAQITN